MRDSLPLGAGREFDIIRDLVRRWGDAARGIGDDAAIINVPANTRLVVSTDASVENVHFRREWLTPTEIGYRAAAAALSDLAAMAATPLGMLVALSVPDSWRPRLSEIADGLGDASRVFNATILGGNLTTGAELSITMTVLGSAAEPLRRDGARAGDVVYVTGTLGATSRALAALDTGIAPTPEHRARLARPSARIREAAWLAARGATAAIDISDGLIADAGHLAAASGIDIHIELEAVPVVSHATPAQAVASGEEYELAVTTRTPFDEHAFAREFGVPLTRIGTVVAAADERPRARLRSRGAFVDPPAGHDHFSR